MSRLRIIGLLVVIALLSGMAVSCSTGPAKAKYPEKAVTIVVHAGAGGGSDIFARTFAAANEKDKYLPQPIVVENKPGGSGAVAFAYVAGKKADPYVMVTAVASFLTTPLQGQSQVTYKDFTPIANFAFDEYVIMVKADSPFQSIADVVEAAKAKPKEVKSGGTQLGSSDSICFHMIEKETGAKFNYIVFNSGGEVNAALMGGHIDVAVSNPGEALELVKGGKVRALGVFAEKRLAGWPDLPTMKEQGVDAVYVQNRGLAAPGGIKPEEVKVLEEACKKYTESEAFKTYCTENMLSSAYMDSATFGKWLDEWNGKYATFLKEMGLIK